MVIAEKHDTVAVTADALVLFGMTGDLARKKLYRALYEMQLDGSLTVRVVVGVARSEWSTEKLCAHIRASLVQDGIEVDSDVVDALVERIHYVAGDYNNPDTFVRLAAILEGCATPVAYLAIPPFAFETVIEGLAANGLDRSRVVVEKPFGRDLASSRELDEFVLTRFPEHRVYRIDHFLGKEEVLNLIVFRFSNSILEPLWSRHFVASVTINMFEAFDVDGRGAFYDEVGALRDVVQNHLLQVVTLLAMEPPVANEADALADESVKVLRAIRPFDPANAVRGQYDGYRDEPGVAPDSDTETFLDVSFEVDSWRWAGVPWRIVTGKAMDRTLTEAIVEFKAPPRPLFAEVDATPRPNRLRFILKPNDVVEWEVQAKAPGEELTSEPVVLTLDHRAKEAGPTAYHRLLADALTGDRRLFARGDQVDLSWQIVQPLLENPPAVRPYRPGSTGPEVSR